MRYQFKQNSDTLVHWNKPPMQVSQLRKAIRTVAPYTGFGCLWILSSDLLLGWFVQDPHMITRLSLYKGWAFVVITSALLLLLVWRRLRSDSELQDRLAARQSELEEFLFATSHHLRTPLVNIEVFTGELAAALEHGETVSRDEFLALSRQIRKNTREISTQLNGLSRLHRVLREKPLPQVIRAASLLQGLISRFEEQYITQRSSVVLIGELPSFVADENQIATLFSEVLENAYRHRESSRALELQITGIKRLREVEIVIHDNGPGFVILNNQHIFQPILRHPNGEDQGGIRMGLAIAWRCARWNGGDLRIHSQPGKGTTVTVVLPAA